MNPQPNASQRRRRWLGLLPLLVVLGMLGGLSFVAITAQHSVDTNQAQVRTAGVRTIGRVIQESSSGDSVTVAFLAAGQPLVVQIATDSHADLALGQSVTIVYNRNDPALAYSPSDGPSPITNVYEWIAGLALVPLLVAALSIPSLRARRRARRVLADGQMVARVTVEPWVRRVRNAKTHYITIRNEANGETVGIARVLPSTLPVLEGEDRWELFGSLQPGSAIGLRKNLVEVRPASRLIDPAKEVKWRASEAGIALLEKAEEAEDGKPNPPGTGRGRARAVLVMTNVTFAAMATGVFCLLAGEAAVDSSSPIAWSLIGVALGVMMLPMAWTSRTARLATRRSRDDPGWRSLSRRQRNLARAEFQRSRTAGEARQQLIAASAWSPGQFLRRRRFLAGWTTGWFGALGVALVLLGLRNLHRRARARPIPWCEPAIRLETQCGVCFGCLVPRAAFHAADMADTGTYLHKAIPTAQQPHHLRATAESEVRTVQVRR
jgi:hypothetical protein